MTDEQIESLQTLLRETGPRSISIAVIKEDEPTAFAEQLTSAFVSAGWKVTGHDITVKSSDGVSVMVHCEGCRPPFADRLTVLLGAMNFACVGRTFFEEMPENSLGLFISRNPLATIPKPKID
jgi:hypothetical protein